MKRYLSPQCSYLGAIGALLYLAQCTRPNISFVVNCLTDTASRQHAAIGMASKTSSITLRVQRIWACSIPMRHRVDLPPLALVSVVSQLPGSVALGYLKAQDWSGRSVCTDRMPSDAQVSTGGSKSRELGIRRERTWIRSEDSLYMR